MIFDGGLPLGFRLLSVRDEDPSSFDFVLMFNDNMHNIFCIYIYFISYCKLDLE